MHDLDRARSATNFHTTQQVTMQISVTHIRRLHYENRMFLSLAIVASVVLAFAAPGVPAWLTLSDQGLTLAYVLAAIAMVLASILRMWAGSQLTSARVMAFPVQTDRLIQSGPYQYTRNPIYLADLIAVTGAGLPLGLPGLLLPILMATHYALLIRYEEQYLGRRHGLQFVEYAERVPRLLPRLRQEILPELNTGAFINYDGFRNNALYVFHIAGFAVAAYTREFWHAAIIGLPTLIDWAWIHTRKGTAARAHTAKSVAEKRPSKVFDSVLYASCWEDPALDRSAFQLDRNATVFTITSGGCNALAFLADDPREVIALDINRHQNHLLELKMSAFRELSYEALLRFVGVEASKERVMIYRTLLRAGLSEDARVFWDARLQRIEDGLLDYGRFEQYMRLLRRVMTILVGRTKIDQLFALESAEERLRYYETKWSTLRWKLFLRVFLSRTMMSLVFDKAFFAQLSANFSFGKHFEGRIRFALTELPEPARDPFLRYIFLGGYTRSALPDYLRPENYEAIRARLERITIVSESCESFFDRLPENRITHFNFTNIFEWMPQTSFEALLRKTIRVAAPGAILTYRNLLVPRSRPETLSASLIEHNHFAARLARHDRSFIYSSYHVEQVEK